LPVLDFEYLAREGGFSVPLAPEEEDGVLLPHGHLLEFIPVAERGRGGGGRDPPREARARPLLALDRLLFLEQEGKVGYRWGAESAELEKMDYLEFIARVTSHIPDKGQVMVRYYGLYANAHRGKVSKANRVPVALGMIAEDPPPVLVFEEVVLMAADESGEYE
jgi:hypothetical protein